MIFAEKHSISIENISGYIPPQTANIPNEIAYKKRVSSI
jgi:hypothetical protein